VTKKALDEIMWWGDFPQTYKKLRRAVLKTAFQHDFLRAAAVLAGKSSELVKGVELLTKEDIVSEQSYALLLLCFIPPPHFRYSTSLPSHL
jgi:hypothetical protein